MTSPVSEHVRVTGSAMRAAGVQSASSSMTGSAEMQRRSPRLACFPGSHQATHPPQHSDEVAANLHSLLRSGRRKVDHGSGRVVLAARIRWL
jgi:hypothetical protein